MRRVLVCAVVLASLTGCADRVFAPAYDMKGAEPDVRQLVISKSASLFVDPDVRLVSVTDPRETQLLSGPAWRSCLKIFAPSMNGSSGIKTYVIAVQNGEVADRRLATADDRCEAEKFESLETATIGARRIR